jgi:hypothetical protein
MVHEVGHSRVYVQTRQNAWRVIEKPITGPLQFHAILIAEMC